MNFTDEKDYIMRMIKEMVRVLFSLAFGKKYVSVELEKENKYEVSGKNLKNFLNMIDLGQINEAENGKCLLTYYKSLCRDHGMSGRNSCDYSRR